jgi:hypothetical protein
LTALHARQRNWEQTELLVLRAYLRLPLLADDAQKLGAQFGVSAQAVRCQLSNMRRAAGVPVPYHGGRFKTPASPPVPVPSWDYGPVPTRLGLVLEWARDNRIYRLSGEEDRLFIRRINRIRAKRGVPPFEVVR